MQNNLEKLVAIVAKVGVSVTCDKICGFLNASADIQLCTSLCDAIGIQEFWEMFEDAGINPIWACEIVDACKVGKNPAVSLTTAGVNPAYGPAGTTFDFTVQFTVINETGVGEAAFVVYFPGGTNHLLGDIGYIIQQVFSDYLPGEYSISMPFPTNSTYIAGKYLVVFYLCSGACGQNPDPTPVASDEYAFNVTQALTPTSTTSTSTT